MTSEQFRSSIATATTAEELRLIVDEFKPDFERLSNADKIPVRKVWKQRQVELGVIV